MCCGGGWSGTAIGTKASPGMMREECLAGQVQDMARGKSWGHARWGWGGQGVLESRGRMRGSLALENQLSRLVLCLGSGPRAGVGS